VRSYLYFTRRILRGLARISFKFGFEGLTRWLEYRAFEVEVASYDDEELKIYKMIFGEEEGKE